MNHRLYTSPLNSNSFIRHHLASGSSVQVKSSLSRQRLRLLSTAIFLVAVANILIVQVQARAPHRLYPEPVPPFDTEEISHQAPFDFHSYEATNMPHDSQSPTSSPLIPSGSHTTSYYDRDRTSIVATVPQTQHNAVHSASLYPPAPSSLRLEQVHIYVRHGERTPVSVRLDKGPHPVPSRWKMCFGRGKLPADPGSEQAEDVKHVVNGWVNREEKVNGKRKEIGSRKLLFMDNPNCGGMGQGIQVEGSDGSVMDGECLLGELTDIGRQSTYNFGLYLREIYISKHRLLPSTLSPSDKKKLVYFRSTYLPRTVESLQHVIHGLYPPSSCPDHSPSSPEIKIRNVASENLYPNSRTCKRLESLLLSFADNVAADWNPILSQFDDSLKECMGGKLLRVDGKPRANGVMDTVRAALANGVEVPEEFEDEAGVTEVVDRAVVEEWFSGYRTHEVCKLGIGPLLTDMVRKMKRHIESKEDKEPRLLVHSTHDTAVASVLQGLGVFDDRWPPFTASITFELYSTGSEYYIRLLYQSRGLCLPFCAAEGKHLAGYPEFCQLDVFDKTIGEWATSEDEWDEACKR